MGLLRLFSLVIVTLQFCGNFSTASAFIGLLPSKQKPTASVFKRSQFFSPSCVLNESMFERYLFTSKGVEPTGIILRDDVGKFTVAEVKGNSKNEKKITAYALQIDGSGERGYWLPQKITIDIPKTPKVNEPKYVFTPDFTGGSLLVSTLNSLNSSTLRLQRLEGDEVQSNDFSGNIYAMGVYSFAYIGYSGGEWLLHIQNRTCEATDSSFNFRHDQLESIKMSDYDMETSAEVFRIGNGGNLMKSEGLLCLLIFITIWVNLM